MIQFVEGGIVVSVVITTLVENFYGEHLGLKNEHGLSFLIESDNYCVLFDTGQTDAFIRNGKKLLLPLYEVEHAVISHGHYDHSGGFLHLCDDDNLKNKLTLHVHPSFFDKKYGIAGRRTEYLGNDFFREDILRRGHAIKYINDNVVQIVPGVYAVSNFDRTHPEESLNPRFQILKDRTLQNDTFEDEVMLVVESSKGLILLLGCAHPGVMNMIDTVISRFSTPVYAVLGGTHLVEADEKRFERVMEFFKSLACDVIGVSHCTGKKWMDRLSEADSRFFHNRTGSSLMIR